MSKDQDKFLQLSNGGTALTLTQHGNYTIDFTGNSVTFNRGGETTFSDADFAKIATFNFTGTNKIDLVGIAFTDAQHASNFKFEPDANLDKFLASMISQYGVSGTVDKLTVNGGKADVFKLIWDYVDDNYHYYDTGINKVAVELGIAYADYLHHGGTPLTDVVAKYTPDGPDAGTAPDRLQSMHDNLLGNLDVNSIVDKFFDGNSANGTPHVPASYAAGGSNATPDEATGNALLDQIFALHLDGRPIYSGNEGTDPTPTHNWDISHGLLNYRHDEGSDQGQHGSDADHGLMHF